MFKFFPTPHPDEILYSTIARCRTYLGLSNGSFSRIVFGGPLSATIRPTRYLKTIADRLEGTFTADDLALRHTLMPLELPFQPASLRTRLRNRWLRFCPECVREQRRNYGEAYWVRDWQIKEAHLCLKHGCPLVRTPIPAGSGMGNCGFFNLEFALNLSRNRKEKILPLDEEILTEAASVLKADSLYRPNHLAWRAFYMEMLPQLKEEADGRLYWCEMYQNVADHWGTDWLKLHRMNTVMRSNYCDWTAPSWLYHVILMRAVIPEITLKDVLRQVSQK